MLHLYCANLLQIERIYFCTALSFAKKSLFLLHSKFAKIQQKANIQENKSDIDLDQFASTCAQTNKCHYKYFCFSKIHHRFSSSESGYSVALAERSSLPHCSARAAEVFESAVARD